MSIYVNLIIASITYTNLFLSSAISYDGLWTSTQNSMVKIYSDFRNNTDFLSFYDFMG